MLQKFSKKFCAVLTSSVLFISGTALYSLSSSALYSDNAESESKIAEEVIAHMESNDTEIPVWIWYKDIDRNEVDKSIQDKLGYSMDDLESESIYTPSADFLAALARAEKG
jgi:hypothetical protein